MLDRYKKKGGFVQLLTLIETSSKQKQDQFLNLIKQENEQWEKALKEKMLSLDHILKWPNHVLAEVFTRVQPLTLAVVFHGQNEAQIEETFKCLSNTDRRKLLLMMSELNPAPSEKASCVVKLLGEVRGLVVQNVIKLEKFDSDKFIPENIEEKILHEGESARFQKPDAEPVGLVFPEPESASPAMSSDGSHREEIDFLKKKVNQLVSENNQLKHEYQIVKNKLEQIKKIA